LEQNPYAPPKAAVADVDAASAAAPGFPVPGGLYTSGQHFVASFIGSPVAAALIAASNYRKLGRDRDARNVVLWGILATAVLLVVAFVLPAGFPNSVLPLAYSFGVRALAQAAFGDTVNANRSSGGKSGSWWRLIGLSVLALIILGAMIFGAAFVLSYFGVIE
jgi:hypothetical protein